MEIRYLEEFALLARVGNYLEASEQLYIAQSTLSRHIRQLETELDCQLFETETKRIRLTPYGSLLLSYAHELCTVEANCRAELNRLKQKNNNALRISILPSAISYGIIEILGTFSRTHQDISLRFSDMDSKKSMEALRGGEIDFAFTRISDAEDIQQIRLISDRIVAVMSNNHPLSDRSSITLNELTAEKILMPSQGTSIYHFLTKICGFDQLCFQNYGEIERSDNIIPLLNNTELITIMAERPALRYASNGCCIIGITPSLDYSVYLSFLRDVKGTKQSSTFKAFISEILRGGYLS